LTIPFGFSVPRLPRDACRGVEQSYQGLVLDPGMDSLAGLVAGGLVVGRLAA